MVLPDLDKNYWQIYRNDDLKFEFKYPSRLGEFGFYIGPQSIGGFFPKNQNIGIAGRSENYYAERSIDISDFMGFEKKENNYYLKLKRGTESDPDWQEGPISPKAVISENILLVDCMSYIEKCKITGPSRSLARNDIAGLINLKNQKFPGLMILTKKDDIGEKLLLEILSTFKFID